MHAFSLIAALGAAPLALAARSEYLGCFGDSMSDRVLTAKWTSSTMTRSVCANYCRQESPSFAFFATQYGEECWCQDSDIHLRHGEGTCDYECAGDSSTLCGGFDSFSLYELKEEELPTPPTDSNYVGCHADDRDDRVLGAMTASDDMTPEICAAACASESSSNMYYATQYGTECWCAADVDLRHGEGVCDFACAGDVGTTCGGFDSFDLFMLEGPLLPPTEDYYLGCFADDTEDRVLGYKQSSSQMTLEACEDYCVENGKRLFALQYGEECWCGGCDLLPKGPGRFDRHGTASCADYPCSGDATRQCGGYDAFSLYFRGTCGPATVTPTTAPPTPGPATETPSTEPPTTAAPTTVAPTTAPPTTAPPTAAPDACNPNTCLNGGTCAIDPAGGHRCACSGDFLGMRCQIDASGLDLFYIEVEFLDEENLGIWNRRRRAIFQAAADRWAQVIKRVPCGGTTLYPAGRVLIRVTLEDIDGTGGMIGSSGPRLVWRQCPTIAAAGAVRFDISDLDLASSMSEDIILREVGHAIGIGTRWEVDGFSCTTCRIDGDPEWTCPALVEEYNDLLGEPDGTEADVVETEGGQGASCISLDETIFGNEIMTGTIITRGNPISKLTAAGLEDIKYIVDPDAVDDYTLPISGTRNLNTEDAFEVTSLPVETTIDVVDENGDVGQVTGITIETYI